MSFKTIKANFSDFGASIAAWLWCQRLRATMYKYNQSDDAVVETVDFPATVAAHVASPDSRQLTT